MTIPFRKFNSIYQRVLKDVFKKWTPEMQDELATHNSGWSVDQFDFNTYLKASSLRFYEAYIELKMIKRIPSICDIGGFWGVFPITLKELGYNVTMTEALQYYSHAFDDLFSFIESKGVKIVNYDPFKNRSEYIGKFDAVFLLAVIEHYPHSLKALMGNIAGMLKKDSVLYIETPNIGHWPKRYNLLLGKSPLSPIENIYRSEVPFIGHHHEFTIYELKELAILCNLKIESENFYNYSPFYKLSIKNFLRNPFYFLIVSLFKNCRECIAISCRYNVK